MSKNKSGVLYVILNIFMRKNEGLFSVTFYLLISLTIARKLFYSDNYMILLKIK